MRSHPCRVLQTVYEQPIEAEVGRDGEATSRGDGDGVGLRLSFRVLAFPLMLNDGRGGAESPFRPKRQTRHGRRAAVGDDKELTVAVDRQITGAGPAGWPSVDFAQLPGCIIDCEGCNVRR